MYHLSNVLIYYNSGIGESPWRIWYWKKQNRSRTRYRACAKIMTRTLKKIDMPKKGSTQRNARWNSQASTRIVRCTTIELPWHYYTALCPSSAPLPGFVIASASKVGNVQIKLVNGMVRKKKVLYCAEFPFRSRFSTNNALPAVYSSYWSISNTSTSQSSIL